MPTTRIHCKQTHQWTPSSTENKYMWLALTFYLTHKHRYTLILYPVTDYSMDLQSEKQTFFQLRLFILWNNNNYVFVGFLQGNEVI